MTKLTYTNGEFILEDPSFDMTLRILQEKNNGGSWRASNPDDYCTNDFKEANVFRKYADASAEKVLNRAFVTKYTWSGFLPEWLDNHQREGIAWILSRSRSYLAHAPGAGKTCEAISAAILANVYLRRKTLIVCPPPLTENWKREIIKWAKRWDTQFPMIDIVPETKNKDDLTLGTEYLICPDSMIIKDWVLQMLSKVKWSFVAVDEASRFKDHKAQRSIALFGGKLKDGTQTPGLVYDCKHAVLLDGSPLVNKHLDLWAPTYAMSPESIDFADLNEFGHKYCGARINDYGKWEFKGSNNGDELKRRLQKDFMHVVTEKELSHPERLRSILYMTKDVRSVAHKKWEKENLSKLDLKSLTDNSSQGGLATFRRELGEKKAPWVSTYVEDRIKIKDESILLFAWHRETIFQLFKRLKYFKPQVIMGGVAQAVREKAISDFQSGECKLLIMNIAAGGRGYNLQRADRIVFAEFSWSDETNIQCEKRASRKGRDQNKMVRTDYICAPNSIDEVVLKTLFRKQEIFKKVIG